MHQSSSPRSIHLLSAGIFKHILARKRLESKSRIDRVSVEASKTDADENEGVHRIRVHVEVESRLSAGSQKTLSCISCDRKVIEKRKTGSALSRVQATLRYLKGKMWCV